MSIYTRTGDDGTTATYGGIRKPKSDLLFYAIGTVDELTSFIGLVINKLKRKDDRLFLTQIQKDLYLVMAVLAGGKKDLSHLAQEVKKIEEKIDKLESDLPKLNKFILPQGSELSSWFHVLRSVCRRAERNVVKFKNNLVIVKYLNRLSDLFFVIARTYGKNKEIVL
jgi:cob(I)alamin adenosyltransferase